MSKEFELTLKTGYLPAKCATGEWHWASRADKEEDVPLVREVEYLILIERRNKGQGQMNNKQASESVLCYMIMSVFSEHQTIISVDVCLAGGRTASK